MIGQAPITRTGEKTSKLLRIRNDFPVAIASRVFSRRIRAFLVIVSMAIPGVGLDQAGGESGTAHINSSTRQPGGKSGSKCRAGSVLTFFAPSFAEPMDGRPTPS